MIAPSPILVDYRWVYANPKEKKGSTPAREALQKAFADDPEGFAARLHKMDSEYERERRSEEKETKAEQARKKGRKDEPDEGSLKAIAMVDKLLEEWHQKRAKDAQKVTNN